MDVNNAIQLAIKNYQTGNLLQAESICGEILKIRPDNVTVLHLLGVINFQSGNYDFAIEFIKTALQFDPNNAEVHYNLGNAFKEAEKLDEAVSHYQRVLRLNRYSAEAYNNLGVAFYDKGQIDEAIRCYQKAVQLKPDFVESYNNLGNALKDKGQFNDAIICYQKALQLNPNLSYVYNNLGIILREGGQIEEAITNYQKALCLDPNFADAHWNMAFALLLTGRFIEGWNELEWRWKLKNTYQHCFTQPLWKGSDITGRTILLHAEQGFGDAIQFIRYAPLVAQCGANVIVECHKELTSLLKSVEGVQEVIGHGDYIPDFDIHCPLLSLPLVFNTTLENIPAKIPYLSVKPSLKENWRNKVRYDKSKLKVGLVWSSGPGVLSQKKSFTIETFSPLFQINDITFYSLQKGKAAIQIKNPPKGIKIVDYTEKINNFSDTAALIENLDLIISVDTAVAHLAGALGKAVWILLPFIPIWQWMLNREDSPWYPTMRLFRQPSPGDWESVISKVSIELQKKITEFK